MDRIVKEKNGIKLRHILWIVLALVFLVLLYQVFRLSKSSTYRIQRDMVSIDTVRTGDFSDHIRILGYVEPIATIYLEAAESGRVVKRPVEEGAMVRQGDVILKLENKEMLLTILEAEARFKEKKNLLRNTRIRLEKEKISLKKEMLLQDHDIKRKQRIYEQNEILFGDKLIPEEEYIRSREDLEYAVKLRELTLDRVFQDSLFHRVEIQQLEDELEINEKNLQFVRDRAENLNVKAPIDGQLSTLEAEIGQTIAKGNPVGQINIMTDFKIRTNIEEHFIDRINKDLKATFERNGKKYVLRIRKLYPEVRDGNFRVDLVFQTDRPDNIRAGQSYQIKLELAAPQTALLLPRGSFFNSTGGQWVYRLEPDGEAASKRSIRIGKQNPQYYEILEGLDPGDRVITSGYNTFGDNARIVLK